MAPFLNSYIISYIRCNDEPCANDEDKIIKKETKMETTSKKTLLHEWHVSHGANMADFGGYEMPLWYSSSKSEHMAVITHAGMFDTSHMAAVLISGPGAFDLLQLCFTNDLGACIGKSGKALFPGRCVYGVYLNEKGGSSTTPLYICSRKTAIWPSSTRAWVVRSPNISQRIKATGMSG